MVGLQVVERGVTVVSRLSSRDHATKLAIELQNCRGGEGDGLFKEKFQKTAKLLCLNVIIALQQTIQDGEIVCDKLRVAQF